MSPAAACVSAANSMRLTPLLRLDRMESIGKPGNFRRRIRVVPRRHGCRCEAFAYFKARFLAAPVHTGYLRSYEDRRFVPPWRRGM
ncbi:hypothetical protein NXT3_CH02357 [Sinorhizobium fredii]|uniref:Uncharacterized protein n=1 Tax=Rhizobium fredii TaxID=380 RepID=A0A2L0H622_RHIFR|nr:hypothetical protein NXT3_CH02357 [Sinorhizobium fredii]